MSGKLHSLISGGGGGGPVPKKKTKRFGPTRTTSLQTVQKAGNAARMSAQGLITRFSRVTDFANSVAAQVSGKPKKSKVKVR
jgi:hypothetical protein